MLGRMHRGGFVASCRVAENLQEASLLLPEVILHTGKDRQATEAPLNTHITHVIKLSPLPKRCKWRLKYVSSAFPGHFSLEGEGLLMPEMTETSAAGVDFALFRSCGKLCTCQILKWQMGLGRSAFPSRLSFSFSSVFWKKRLTWKHFHTFYALLQDHMLGFELLHATFWRKAVSIERELFKRLAQISFNGLVCATWSFFNCWKTFFSSEFGLCFLHFWVSFFQVCNFPLLPSDATFQQMGVNQNKEKRKLLSAVLQSLIRYATKL